MDGEEEEDLPRIKAAKAGGDASGEEDAEGDKDKKVDVGASTYLTLPR